MKRESFNMMLPNKLFTLSPFYLKEHILLLLIYLMISHIDRNLFHSNNEVLISYHSKNKKEI